MKLGKVFAPPAAFLIAIWPVMSPVGSWAQDEAAPVRVEGVEPIGAGLGAMDFTALPVSQMSQENTLDLQGAAVSGIETQSRLPRAAAASAEAEISGPAPTTATLAFEAPEQAEAVVGTPAPAVSVGSGHSGAAAPAASSNGTLFFGSGQGNVRPHGEPLSPGAIADAVKAINAIRNSKIAGFDGSRPNGPQTSLIISPGTPEPEEEDETLELQSLRSKLYGFVKTLERAAALAQMTDDPAAAAQARARGKEASELLKKIETAGMPADAELVALHEMSELVDMSPRDAEAQKRKTYLSWLTAVPWSRHTTDRYDLVEAKKILDRDHSGLDDVKKRVLEFLAVRKRTKSNGGGIILFVGPPGVGKTSIAQAIAEAMGRKFVRFSLGSLSDETVIRGHHRTYLDSRPGSIIYLMKKAAANNPVMLLDEVDKMPQGTNQAGAGSAFLEILDPEQNSTFQDHYMEVPYDLSNVLFIVTANDISSIPAPLRDRMEIIEFSGYTTEEKIDIVKNQVLPQTAKSLNLDPGAITMSNDAMEYLIDSYTAEPGVRNLKREMAAVLRGLLVEEENSGKPMPTNITKEMVREYLGREKYTHREANTDNGVGYASGLAVKGDMGGAVLGFEVVKTPGTGELRLRKQMKEFTDDSAHNAYAYIKNHAAQLGIDPEVLKTTDLDIAISPAEPVDGPSAGITMVTAMASELTGRAVKPGVAMTGEFTLHGAVKAIGGLKDKVMAAYRLGYKTVIFPADNERDLELLPDNVRRNMNLVPVTSIDEVLALALEAPAPAAEPTTAAVVVPQAPAQAPAARRTWRQVLAGWLHVIFPNLP